MNLDIATTVKTILVLVGIGVISSIILAFKSIRTGKNLAFYRKRQELVEQGWKLFLLAFILVIVGFLFYKFAEPVAYRYFPPSPTITRTPTITTTPTITLTLQETYTPTITETLAQTYTPAVPAVVQTDIKTPVGPDVNALFSVVQFSEEVEDGVVINTTNTFTQPVSQIYGGFSFDKMSIGVQWSAVWLHEGQVMCYETKVWGDITGGYGYTDACNQKLSASQWLPGDWEVQIFVGSTWKNSGTFSILPGAQSAATASPTLTPNGAVTSTPTPKNTP